MAKASPLVLGMTLFVQVLAQTCPNASNATSCFSGFSGPSGAVAAMFGNFVIGASGTTTSISSVSAPNGTVCARYTQDCLFAVAMMGNRLLTSSNCPPGQPFTTYLALDQSQGAPSCSYLATVILQISKAQNVLLCGSSNCNVALSMPPPAFTPAQNPCTSAGTATSCYNGTTGPAAAVAAMGGTPPMPTSVPSGSMCVAGSFPCSFAISLGLPDINASNCPMGQSLIQYTNTTAASCFKDVLYFSNLTVCGGSNCNGPTTSSATTISGAGTASDPAKAAASDAASNWPGFTSTLLSAMVLPLAWSKK